MSSTDPTKRKRGAPRQYPEGVISRARAIGLDPKLTYAKIAAIVEADREAWLVNGEPVAPRRIPPTTVKSWLDGQSS